MTVTEPCFGGEAIVTLAGFNELPLLPAASFANIFTVVGVFAFTTAISFITAGGSVVATGSNTIISKGVNGQSEVCPAAHTGI